jgi:uncharacterized protein (DUF342 family)
MISNIFANCPKCGKEIKKDADSCSNCSIQIDSSFITLKKDSYAEALGNLALKNEIITPDQFKSVYDEYKNQNEQKKQIEDILLEKNLISLPNISKLIAATLRSIDKEFCSIAVNKNFITNEEAKAALKEQNMLYKQGTLKSISDILLEKNKLNKEQVDEIFSKESQEKKEAQGSKHEYKPLKQIWKEEDQKSQEQNIKTSLPGKSLKLGRLAVKHNFLTQDNFDKAVQDWSALISTGKTDKNFQTFLVDNNFLDRKKFTILNIHYEYNNLKELDIMFCKLAIMYKFIPQTDADEALKTQNNIFKEKHKLISIPEILSKQGKITGKQVYRILREQKRNELAKKFYEKLELEEQKPPEKKERKVEVDRTSTPSETSQEIRIEISEDALKAFLYPVADNTEVLSIKLSAREKGIVYGLINDDVIKTFIEEGSKTPLTIANGKPATQPVNAEIKCHFSEDYLNVGSIDEKGNIDFKSRGEVPFVESGQLLAEKIPMKQGFNGVDVFGNEIFVEDPFDISIEAGPGTRIDDSGFKVYATEKGKPHIALNGKISVYNIHEINGDVDFHTGHIDFNGNIKIKGSIKPGFRVKGNDIEVEEVEGGEIVSKGFVNIKGGISGGKIYAEHGLQAKYVAQGDITAFGDVSIEKEILESEIRASGLVTTTAGKIISSKIYAKGGVEAKQVGTDVSDPASIEIGSSGYLEKLIEPLQEKIEKFEKDLEFYNQEKEKLEFDHKKTHQDIAEKAQIQDKANQAISKLNEHYDLVAVKGSSKTLEEIRKKIEGLEVKVKEYDKMMDDLFNSQDDYLDKITENNKTIEQLITKKESLIKEIENLVNFDQNIEPSPVLVVHGTIERGTKVKGINSIWKVHETKKNIKSSEVLTRDQNGNEVYIIRTEKRN